MGVTWNNYQQLLKYKIPDIDQTLHVRDTMLYAVGVGVGYDPLDSRQLRFVYENYLLALPTMIAVICAPQGWVRKADTGFGSRMVAGEFSFSLASPLPVEGEFSSKVQITSIIDQGKGKARC